MHIVGTETDKAVNVMVDGVSMVYFVLLEKTWCRLFKTNERIASEMSLGEEAVTKLISTVLL